MKRSTRGSAWFVIMMVLMSIVFLVASSTKAAANIYYVATNGNDNRSCDAAQDINTPKRNIMGTRGGIACMQTPGDKLLIRGGTYAESITESIDDYTAAYPLPSGTDWDNAFTVVA